MWKVFLIGPAYVRGKGGMNIRQEHTVQSGEKIRGGRRS